MSIHYKPKQVYKLQVYKLQVTDDRYGVRLYYCWVPLKPVGVWR